MMKQNGFVWKITIRQLSIGHCLKKQMKCIRKKRRIVAESRTNFTLERRKKQPALLICANCGHSLLKETEHLLKCSDARTNGDPVCRSLVIRREPMEENILGLVHQYAASMLEKEKKVSSNRQCDDKEINTAELQKQSRQLTSEKMKLYDDYKDGRIDRDSYKQRAEKISGQLDEIKRKIEDAKNNKKLLEQNELSDKIKENENQKKQLTFLLKSNIIYRISLH